MIVRAGASYGEGAAQRSDGMGGANIADALAVACALDRRVVTVSRTPLRSLDTHPHDLISRTTFMLTTQTAV